MSKAQPQKPKTIRCAIYTRKSDEDGLEQEFNSLHAQRESGESYVASMKHEGWQCLPTCYDDGGFTGANMNRPGLRQLLADIEAGKIDCVVVYKVDRLSRSLLDFARIMETFDKHAVSFVSVTQQFSTTSSIGRLTLNMLLSFAQFEREMISERTRDKMAAARRKGKYVGGAPLLGYDIVNTKLVVNAAEANRVRKIFDLYLEHEALIPTVQELNRRGRTTKEWTTRKGKRRGGVRFTKTNLYNLLTNVAYAGKIRYRDEVFKGEHDAIVDIDKFERVQQILRHNHRSGGSDVRNRFGALLKGRLFCGPCGSAMTPAHTTKGSKRYRYYACVTAQKQGWAECPSKSIPAAEIERFVVDQIKAIGRDPDLVAETLAQSRRQAEADLAELATERKAVERDVAQAETEIRQLAAHVGHCGEETPASARLADLLERVRVGQRRQTEIREEMDRLQGGLVSEAEVAEALGAFDPLWESLSPREQARVLELLVERVEYDGNDGTVAVTFRPTGIRSLTEEFAFEDTAA